MCSTFASIVHLLVSESALLMGYEQCCVLVQLPVSWFWVLISYCCAVCIYCSCFYRRNVRSVTDSNGIKESNEENRTITPENPTYHPSSGALVISNYSASTASPATTTFPVPYTSIAPVSTTANGTGNQSSVTVPSTRPVSTHVTGNTFMTATESSPLLISVTPTSSFENSSQDSTLTTTASSKKLWRFTYL